MKARGIKDDTDRLDRLAQSVEEDITALENPADTTIALEDPKLAINGPAFTQDTVHLALRAKIIRVNHRLEQGVGRFHAAGLKA
jgi:hypothetical protein